VHSTPEALAVWFGEKDGAEPAPWPRYTLEAENTYGLNNHFQSIQRLRIGPYAVVSGSDVNGPMSQLFLAEVPSRCAAGTGRWGSNLDGGAAPRRPEPPADDKVELRTDVEQDRWHPGGLALLGDVLAAGLDHGDGGARVQFFDTAAPRELKPLFSVPLDYDRSDAVGLASLPDGRVLMGLRLRDHFRFYRSLSTTLTDGFEADAGFWVPDAGDVAIDFQNIALVRQCDGALFMIGLHNTSAGSPFVEGQDVAWLYALEPGPPPTLTPLAQRNLDCAQGYCNFDAAGGVFITDDGELILYGAPHYRQLAAPGGTALLLKLSEH
jgi:hypothetical protein